MHIVVLGASGATGQLLVTEALERGLRVTAIARDPRRVPVPDRTGLTKVAADVNAPGSIARAVEGGDVVLSGLGITKGGPARTLSAGAAAIVRSGVPRIVWLGAFGTGRSARAAGRLTRTVLAVVLKGELADKVAADEAVLAAGGTVFHAGPLGGGPAGGRRRTLTLDEAPHRIFPAGVSRATVAAAMVDEAVQPRFPGRIVIPVGA
jgi:uncharacterized protein YbjT (DUF2867 family)